MLKHENHAREGIVGRLAIARACFTSTERLNACQRSPSGDDMQPEEALRQAGDFGLFQYLLITYLCVLVAPVRVMPLFAHIFSFLVPPHRCKVPLHLYEGLNVSGEALLGVALPRETDGSLSQCRMYDVNATLLRWLQAGTGAWVNFSKTTPSVDLETTSCQFGWEYDFSLIYPSVVSEMDWVCESSWKAYVANTVFWVSTAVGVLICGNLSDRVGRVLVIVGVNLLCGGAGLYTFFTEGFLHFVLSRVFLGLVMLALSITPFVLGDIDNAPFVFGAVVEYVAPERRMMVLSGFQFVPESLRWLVSRGKEARAKKILRFIAKVNGKVLSDEFMGKCRFPAPNESQKPKDSPTDMLKTPNLRKNFLLTLAAWMLACLVYTAGQLYAANASHNPFLMTTAVNAVDIVATATALPLADRWGRRPTMMTTYSLAAFAYLFAVCVPAVSFFCIGPFYSAHQWQWPKRFFDGRSLFLVSGMTRRNHKNNYWKRCLFLCCRREPSSDSR
ncbi:hypothetical protein HPB47_014356 [Ixodes persulcatus]|uniref:Uncharacterized protein n=1 Tax=Ixodes persulcatus TaxID=34615 RepID=A0AC60QYS1_IXOPE|nr:hypothetical protein HPB47_014356 [Ixodes persulcatus]